jgi:hypothetical protein
MVRAVLPNPKMELRPGMFVTAFMHGAMRPNAIVVPQLAIQQGSDGHLVYVINASNVAEIRPVVVGDYVGEKDIVVMQGLHAGDRVVIDGVLKVVPGKPVTIAGPATRRSDTRRRPLTAPAAPGKAPAAPKRRRNRPPMFTHFFIDRPILSSVISILILLGGASRYRCRRSSNIRGWPPQVDQRQLPRRHCRRVANQVAAPIEAQINGVTTCSTSVDQLVGRQRFDQCVFKPGTDPDIASNVQNRVSRHVAVAAGGGQQGVEVDKNSSGIMMVLSIYSPDERYTSTYIDNYTNLYVLDELKRVPGANRAR